MKRLNFFLLIFTLLSPTVAVAQSNKASHSSLVSIEFKKTSISNLENNGWSFFATNMTISDEVISLPAISNQGLKLSPYGSTSPLFTPNDGSPISDAYSEVIITVRYRLNKKTIGFNDYLKIYLDDNISTNSQSETEILHDDQAHNKWKTLVYTLTREQLDKSAMSLRFFTGSFLPDIDIKSIEISGLPVNEEPALSAAFIASSQYLASGDTIELFDLSDGNPTEWLWTINNVTTGSGSISRDIKQPAISLTEDGFYDVTLRVKDASSAESSVTKGNYLAVGCPSYALNPDAGHIACVTLTQGETQIFSQSSGAKASTFYDYTSSASIIPENDLTLTVEVADLLNNTGELFADSVLVRVWFGYYSNTSEFTNNYLDVPIKIAGTGGTGSITFSTMAASAPGNLIMRVKLSNTSADMMDACQIVTNGEVETYALTARHATITSYLGNALVFNGGYLQVGDGLTAQSGIYKSEQSEFTFGGWIKRASSDDYSLFSQGRGEADADKSFDLRINKKHIEVVIDGNTIMSRPLWSTTSENVWAHTNVVGTGTEIQLYIANKLVASTPLEGPYFKNSALDTYTRIGSANFRGQLEGTLFWSVARSEEQLRDGFYRTIDNNSEGLLAYYQYNYGTLSGQTQVHDWHGNHHATIYGDLDVMHSFAPFLFTPSEETLKSTSDLNEVEVDIFDPSNWSWHASELPSQDSKVVIDGNVNMIINTGGNTLQVASLELSNGSKVSIAEGSAMNIKDSIIFRTTHDAPSSFLGFDKLANIDVDVYVENLLTTNRNWYLGVIGDHVTFEDINGKMYTGDPDAEWDFYVYEWNPIKGWVLITNEQASIEPLRGYLFHSPNSTPYLFYNGRVSYEQNQSIVLNERGYHLVSNPYWTYLSLHEMVNGGHAGSANFTNGTFNSSFTLWTTINDERVYAHYDATNSLAAPEESLDENGLLAPGQAFFVFNNNQNSTFQVDRSMLTQPANTNPSLKSASETNNQVIRVKVSNAYSTYDAAIALRDNGSLIKTTNDTELRKAKGKTPMVYTQKSDRDNQQHDLAINILPNDFKRLVIPIGIEVYADGVGPQTMEITGLSDMPDIKATLITPDGAQYDATQTHQLNIDASQPGTLEGFQLVLERVATTIEPTEKSTYTVYSESGNIKVRYNEQSTTERTITITNMNGTVLCQQQSRSDYFNYQVPVSGMYIVTITDDKAPKSHKLVVVK